MTEHAPSRITLDLTPRSVWPTVTLRELIEAYIQDHDMAAGSRRAYARLLRGIARVDWRGSPVTDLELVDVTAVVVQRIHDVLARRGRTVGEQACKLIGAAWRWGRRPNRGLVPGAASCPVEDVEVRRTKPTLPAINPDVMRAMWLALDGLDAHPQAIRFLRAEFLTALRPWDELLPMRCDQIYRSGGKWAIRFDKHKTSRKTGAKVLGLGAMAAAVLLEQRECAGGSGPLWPSIRFDCGAKMSPKPVRAAWRKLVERAREMSPHVDIDPRLYIYRSRSGAAITALEQGATLTEVKQLLGHASLQTTFAYLAAAPGVESQTSDRIAALVVDGNRKQSLGDVAAVVGCDPSLTAVADTIKTACNRLGVAELAEVIRTMDDIEIEKVPLSDLLAAYRQVHTAPPAAPPSLPAHIPATNRRQWQSARFVEAARAAGYDGPKGFARAFDKWLVRGGSPSPDLRTPRSWWDGKSPRDYGPAVADFLGVSLDWLYGIDDDGDTDSGERGVA